MDLSPLRTVLTGTAPTSTVWIDTSRADENGRHEVQLRRQDLADRLRAEGAPDADIQALVGRAVAPTGRRPRTLVVGPGPHDIALPGGPRTWQGASVTVPADLALVRAAVLTDADVQPVPGGDEDVPDGAAALLRWRGPESPAPLRDGVPLP